MLWQVIYTLYDSKVMFYVLGSTFIGNAAVCIANKLNGFFPSVFDLKIIVLNALADHFKLLILVSSYSISAQRSLAHSLFYLQEEIT